MINNSNSKDVIWLDTFSDLVAGVKAFNQCMTTADVMSDEDWRLVCADTNSNLKVFKGNILQNEAKLHYTPVGIVSFYAPDTNGRNCVPYVAVAGGSYIFIYKNLKGAYKFCLPNIEPNEDEVQIWNELKENKIDCKSARSKLVDLNKNTSDLSTRSREFISLKDEQEILKFSEERKNIPIVISNFVVHLTTLKKNNPAQLQSTSQLVVGTESGMVYIIDHSGTRIINKFVIPSVPHQIVAVGAYDVDYSIYVATRNNTIYTIHNGEVSLNTKIEVGNSIVSMIKTDKSLLITTINCLYHSYNTNSGKKNFSICMPSTIICMEMFESKKGNFKAAMIALRNFEIRMYSEKNLINVLTLNENIFGLKFGRFGKEEESLVILTDTGSLLIKSLSSTVNIESLSYSESKRNMEEINLNVPKKTKLYLDLIEREKECAGNMNQVFQSDLAKIKYKAMDTFVKMLKIGNAPQNYNSTTNVKVSASFQGLGPNFKLNLIVDNGGDELIYGADLILDYERSIFSFEKENIQLGVIMPKVPMRYSLKFKNISERGASGLIKIIILDKTSPTPLVQSTLKVPISELEIL